MRPVRRSALVAALLASACVNAGNLAAQTAATSAGSQAERDQLFDGLLAAIRARDSAAVARLSRQNDIMYMRGYLFITAEDLLARLQGCTVASTMRPTVEGGMAGMRFSCPGRAARVALQPCDSGNLFLGAVPKQGRLQMSLDETRRRDDPACVVPAPAPPPPLRRPAS
jgi:hypothetical protein